METGTDRLAALLASLLTELQQKLESTTPLGDALVDDTNDAVRVNVVAGGVTHVDDAAFTPATDDVVPAAGLFDDTLPDSVDEGDAGVVRMSANRNLYVRVRDNAGNERGLNIDASGRALVDASGVAVPVTDNATTLSVDDGAGTLTVDQATASNLNAQVVGSVAHDAAASGNPLQMAGTAQDMDDTAPPNQVSAEGDETRLAVDRDGALFVRLSGPRVWSYHENSSNALTDTSVHAAPGAGLSLYVTDIICSTGAATALNVFFEEGATTVLGPWYLEAVAGRGLALHFITPKKITANTALTVTTSAAIAHGLDILGFIAPG